MLLAHSGWFMSLSIWVIINFWFKNVLFAFKFFCCIWSHNFYFRNPTDIADKPKPERASIFVPRPPAKETPAKPARKHPPLKAPNSAESTQAVDSVTAQSRYAYLFSMPEAWTSPQMLPAVKILLDGLYITRGNKRKTAASKEVQCKMELLVLGFEPDCWSHKPVL